MTVLKFEKRFMVLVARRDQLIVKIRKAFVKCLELREYSTFYLLTLSTVPRFEFSKVNGIYTCLYGYDLHLHQITAV